MSVFEFKDSRSFLREYIDKLPKKGRGEVTRLANHLSASSTLISHILAGEKLFTIEQAQLVCEYLGLLDLEADYFIFLIQFERAGSQKLKKYWQAKLDDLKNKSQLIANRVRKDKVLSEEEKAIFYSSPIYMAIRLFVSMKDEGQSLKAISDQFNLTQLKAAEILKFLTECEVVLEENNLFKLASQSLVLAKGSPHLTRYHTDWRLKGLQKAERLSDEELMITCPATLSKADFKKLREEMIVFVQKFLKTAHESTPEQMVCFNMDWFYLND